MVTLLKTQRCRHMLRSPDLLHIIVFTAFLLLPVAALAQTPLGCFARTYDAPHLAAHPGQTVSAVKVKLKPRSMDDGYNFSVELRFGFREDKRNFYAVGICKDMGGSLTCSLDQDAGQLTVKPADGGVQVSPLQDVRADAESGDEAEYKTLKTSNPEDRVFMLRAVEASDCNEFDTED
jgi:hypothetical protein